MRLFLLIYHWAVGNSISFRGTKYQCALLYFHPFGTYDAQCRQLEKLQTGVDTVIADVKVVFPFCYFSSFQFSGGAEGHKHAEWKAGAIFLWDLHRDEGQDKEQGALCGAQHGPSKVSLPYIVVTTYIFAVLFPTVTFNLSSKCSVKLFSDIPLLAVECWLCSRHFLRVMIQSRTEDETGCLHFPLLIYIHFVSCYYWKYLLWQFATVECRVMIWR